VVHPRNQNPPDKQGVTSDGLRDGTPVGPELCCEYGYGLRDPITILFPGQIRRNGPAVTVTRATGSAPLPNPLDNRRGRSTKIGGI
jgi:hypothetical protein